jgi:predicted amidohydrolase
MTLPGSLRSLRVAAVQAESRAGEVEHNIVTAAGWVEKAAAAGAQLVVLPELFIPGYDPETLRNEPDRCDVTPDDARLMPLSDAARTAGVTVIVGASVRESDGARSLAVLAFGPSGDVRTAYAKQHLWDAERSIFTPGGHGTTLVLDGWDLGLGICYDGCFPEHARAATDAGALVYVCPSAYVVGSEHRRDLYYAARAIDNGIWVVFAGLVGRCGDLEFNGGTAVYDPQGRTVEQVESGEGMVVVDLDLEAVAEARRINPYERDRVDDGADRVVLTAR